MATVPASPAAQSDETLFQFIARHLELLKAREIELGGYFGDGPTAAQADDLIAHLEPMTRNEMQRFL